jgi:serine/threonine protein kinase
LTIRVEIGLHPAEDHPQSGGRPGLRLGRFRLIEPLGRGSQGEVWRALQVEPIVEEVALKLLCPERVKHAAYRSQFHREAEWAARLVSPWLLPAYEFGATTGFLFLAMPLVDGDTLSAVIIRRRRRLRGFHPPLRHWLDRLPLTAYLRAVVAIMSRVARAAATAHAGRVAHRDIKPANILIDRHRADGIYLCDFGLGRDLDAPPPSAWRHGTGTPLYMAPERLLGEAADEILCDVYALGVTLAEAATLVPPFAVPAGLPPREWPQFLARYPLRRPREVAPWLPASIETIIDRALSHDPGARYHSMTAFAQDLERAYRQGL